MWSFKRGHIGDHPQGDLAMFGYRPAMDVKFTKILLYPGYSVEKCVGFKIDFGLLDRLSKNWVITINYA